MHEDRVPGPARPAEELAAPLRQAIEQARDRAVPEAALARSLDRARRVAVVAPLHPPRVSRRLLVGAAAAVLLAAGAGLWLFRPADTWADVARAVEARPWVHGTSTAPDGKTTELWFAPGREVMAGRDPYQATFYDQRLRILWTYEPAEKVLYRVPDAFGSHQEEFRSLQETFAALFRAAPSLSVPPEGGEIVDQKQRRVLDGGRQWVEYDLTVRAGTGPDGPLARLVFRVDPASHLPHAVTFTNLSPRADPHNRECTCTFDYPEKGPADVYDLGVPRSAKLVDRVPGDDLARVLAGLRAGRDRLGPYRADVAELRSRETRSFDQLHRLWHDGRRWRVGMWQPGPGAAAPAGAPAPAGDEAWWRTKLDGTSWQGVEVSDGRAVYEADFSNTVPQTYTYRPKVRLTAADDAWLCSQYLTCFPEFWTYPHVPVPSQQFEALVDPRAGKGPPDTVALVVRMAKASVGSYTPEAYHWERYWLDPTRNYVVVRGELGRRFPEEAGVGDADPAEAPGFLDMVYTVEKLDRSPQGVWYPTLVREQLRGREGKLEDRFYRYRVDFPATLPEEVFQPTGGTAK